MDTINRESAIVQATKWIKDDSVAHDVKEAIKHIPPAQRWIPCKERLPQKETMYLTAQWFEDIGDVAYEAALFTKELHDMDERFPDDGKSGFVKFYGDWGWKVINADWWMEIPEVDVQGAD